MLFTRLKVHRSGTHLAKKAIGKDGLNAGILHECKPSHGHLGCGGIRKIKLTFKSSSDVGLSWGIFWRQESTKFRK